SPKSGRRGRVALACLVILIIAGALVAKFGYEPATDGALLIAHGDANADTVPTVGQATTTAETSPAPEGGATACEGDSSGRDARCGVAKVRKVKSRRAANEGATIAALPLGRTVLLAPEPSAVDPAPPTRQTAMYRRRRLPTWPARERRRRRCERRRVGLVATIGRASGDCPPRNGAPRPMRPTTVTCAAAMTSRGAGPGKACRRDRRNPTHLEA